MQCGSVAGCVQSLVLTQKCSPRTSEFWPKLAFLLEQQIKFLFTVTLLINLGQFKMAKVQCQYDSVCSFMGPNRPTVEVLWLRVSI